MTNTVEPAIPPPVFQDRKTLLVVFGILLIFLGAICALMAPLMVFSLVVSKFAATSAAAPPNVRVMIPGLFFYIALAIWFIWIGIGSIKARRWARALILVSSWLWLICGVIGLIVVFAILPDMLRQMPETSQLPQAFFIVMKVIMALFMLIFFVFVPGTLILVYSRANVKSTCEFWDRQVRWTDKCPLPVLALVVLFGFGAFSMLGMLFYARIFPFFGVLVSGMPGVLMILVVAALFAYLSRGMYRLDIQAWWVAVVSILLISLSTIVTFSRVNLLDLYAAMDFPPQQIELMKQYGIQDSPLMLFSGLWGILMAGYLVYVRKYFKSHS